MTTGTLTLTEFLLARIAEDEAVAGRLHDYDCPMLEHLHFYGWQPGESISWEFCCGRPARVLAECGAKRHLVEHFGKHHGGADGFEIAAGYALEYIALPYADHPDYREEWRA